MTPRIIRTIEELRDLDPDTLLIYNGPPASYGTPAWGDIENLPAVIVSEGEQVRAARTELDYASSPTASARPVRRPLMTDSRIIRAVEPLTPTLAEALRVWAKTRLDEEPTYEALVDLHQDVEHFAARAEQIEQERDYHEKASAINAHQIGEVARLLSEANCNRAGETIASAVRRLIERRDQAADALVKKEDEAIDECHRAYRERDRARAEAERLQKDRDDARNVISSQNRDLERLYREVRAADERLEYIEKDRDKLRTDVDRLTVENAYWKKRALEQQREEAAND